MNEDIKMDKREIIIFTPYSDFGMLVRDSLSKDGSRRVISISTIDAVLSTIDSIHSLDTILIDLDFGMERVRECVTSIRDKFPGASLILISKEVPPAEADDLAPWKLLRKPFVESDLLDLFRFPASFHQSQVIEGQSFDPDQQGFPAWARDRRELEKTLSCLLPELDVVEAFIISEQGILAQTNTNETITIIDSPAVLQEYLGDCQQGEVIKKVHFASSRYILHETILAIGIVLAILYNENTPYRIIRNQSKFIANRILNPQLQAIDPFALPEGAAFESKEHLDVREQTDLDNEITKPTRTVKKIRIVNQSSAVDRSKDDGSLLTETNEAQTTSEKKAMLTSVPPVVLEDINSRQAGLASQQLRIPVEKDMIQSPDYDLKVEKKTHQKIQPRPPLKFIKPKIIILEMEEQNLQQEPTEESDGPEGFEEFEEEADTSSSVKTGRSENSWTYDGSESDTAKKQMSGSLSNSRQSAEPEGEYSNRAPISRMADAGQMSLPLNTLKLDHSEGSFTWIANGSKPLVYACVLIPRFTSTLLVNDLERYVNEALGNIFLAYGWRLESVMIDKQYLQWIVRLPPTVSLDKHIRTIRSESSKMILGNFPRLSKEGLVKDFWAPGYLLESGPEPISIQEISEFIRVNRDQYYPEERAAGRNRFTSSHFPLTHG